MLAVLAMRKILTRHCDVKFRQKTPEYPQKTAVRDRLA